MWLALAREMWVDVGNILVLIEALKGISISAFCFPVDFVIAVSKFSWELLLYSDSVYM